ncbi:MAG: hypothetical protein J0M20_09905 [Burkholderiales bacterium]|nr:hypothetical protein [Burkholderiales bacterium]
MDDNTCTEDDDDDDEVEDDGIYGECTDNDEDGEVEDDDDDDDDDVDELSADELLLMTMISPSNVISDHSVTAGECDDHDSIGGTPTPTKRSTLVQQNVLVQRHYRRRRRLVSFAPVHDGWVSAELLFFCFVFTLLRCLLQLLCNPV